MRMMTCVYDAANFDVTGLWQRRRRSKRKRKPSPTQCTHPTSHVNATHTVHTRSHRSHTLHTVHTLLHATAPPLLHTVHTRSTSNASILYYTCYNRPAATTGLPQQQACRKAPRAKIAGGPCQGHVAREGHPLCGVCRTMQLSRVANAAKPRLIGFGRNAQSARDN